MENGWKKSKRKDELSWQENHSQFKKIDDKLTLHTTTERIAEIERTIEQQFRKDQEAGARRAIEKKEKGI